jgi:integrase
MTKIRGRSILATWSISRNWRLHYSLGKRRQSTRTICSPPCAATELVGAEIFRNPRTGKSLDDYEVSQRAFDYCCRKAGVRRRNQYQTRHSYASNMLMTGENPLFVAHQMGHKNVKMLFEVYAKYIPGHSMNRAGYGKRSKQGSA